MTLKQLFNFRTRSDAGKRAAYSRGDWFCQVNGVTHQIHTLTYRHGRTEVNFHPVTGNERCWEYTR